MKKFRLKPLFIAMAIVAILVSAFDCDAARKKTSSRKRVATTQTSRQSNQKKYFMVAKARAKNGECMWTYFYNDNTVLMQATNANNQVTNSVQGRWFRSSARMSKGVYERQPQEVVYYKAEFPGDNVYFIPAEGKMSPSYDDMYGWKRYNVDFYYY